MKINMTVTRIIEKYKEDNVRIEADIEPGKLSLCPNLDIRVKKGELDLGDKIVVTVEKQNEKVSKK